MKNLITEARELCEKAMALEIPTERLDYSTEYVPLVDAIHIIPELCDALEQAELEKVCEFCQSPYKSIDSGKGGNEKSILYMGGSSPYANLSKKYLHFMDAAGRMDLFEVKYCPMCGKRLEVKHE